MYRVFTGIGVVQSATAVFVDELLDLYDFDVVDQVDDHGQELEQDDGQEQKVTSSDERLQFPEELRFLLVAVEDRQFREVGFNLVIIAVKQSVWKRQRLHHIHYMVRLRNL